MPARITVRAELQNLLDKSQALTDANRLQQLEKDRLRRAEREQLAKKRAKVDADRLRKRNQQDPVGRYLRPAAMGRVFDGVGIAWISTESEPYNIIAGQQNSLYYRIKLASGNGQAVVEYEFDYANPTGIIIPNVPNQSVFNAFGTYATFPAPAGLLVVAYVFELVEIVVRTPSPAPEAFVGPEFVRIVETKGWLVSQATVTSVAVANANFDNFEKLGWESRRRDLNNTGTPQNPTWPGAIETGGIDPTPNEIDGISLSSEIRAATPVDYLINDAYAVDTYTTTAAFEARVQELRDADLAGRMFPDAEPVSLSASIRAPSAIPFGGVWTAALSYDFGEKAYVAAKYAQLQSPPPPPP
jgi:hypothetical protein